MNEEEDFEEQPLPTCSICEKPSLIIAHDEDDTVWCINCIKLWEAEHECHWATGQPIE